MGEVMSVNDDELARLRDARRAEIQQQIEAQTDQQLQAEAQQAAAVEQAAALTEAMRTILTPEARDRLARLELAFPELAVNVKQQLAALHSTGRIATPVDDASLKRILQGLDNRRDPTIRRI